MNGTEASDIELSLCVVSNSGCDCLDTEGLGVDSQLGHSTDPASEDLWCLLVPLSLDKILDLCQDEDPM